MHRLFCLCTLLILAGIPSAEPMADAKAAMGDSVTWTPKAPTSKDQIVFTLFDALACCCRDYPSVAASAEDTIIYLGFEYDDQPCMLCKCAGIGKFIDFPAMRVAAGKYGIYKSPQAYCPPGTPCPYRALIPERVGEIIIKDPVSSIRPATTARSGDFSRLMVSNGALTLRIDRAQVVTIEAFTLSGARDARLSNVRRCEAGTSTFSLDNIRTAKEVSFVRVVGEDFSETRALCPVE